MPILFFMDQWGPKAKEPGSKHDTKGAGPSPAEPSLGKPRDGVWGQPGVSVIRKASNDEAGLRWCQEDNLQIRGRSRDSKQREGHSGECQANPRCWGRADTKPGRPGSDQGGVWPSKHMFVLQLNIELEISTPQHSLGRSWRPGLRWACGWGCGWKYQENLVEAIQVQSWPLNVLSDSAACWRFNLF